MPLKKQPNKYRAMCIRCFNVWYQFGNYQLWWSPICLHTFNEWLKSMRMQCIAFIWIRWYTQSFDQIKSEPINRAPLAEDQFNWRFNLLFHFWRETKIRPNSLFTIAVQASNLFSVLCNLSVCKLNSRRWTSFFEDWSELERKPNEHQKNESLYVLVQVFKMRCLNWGSIEAMHNPHHHSINIVIKLKLGVGLL